MFLNVKRTESYTLQGKQISASTVDNVIIVAKIFA